MGEAAYAELEVRCEAHLATVKAVRASGSRKLLPLMVHPATLAARAARPGAQAAVSGDQSPPAPTSGTPPTSTRSRTSASTATA